MSGGTLYLVSTPIGNLDDITPRARAVLGAVSVVYVEDTRRTRKIMTHLDLSTPLVSLHAHNERSRVDAVRAALDDGADVALVTDAGTPGVSDPGVVLVRAIAAAGHAIVAVPGASAVLTALAVSGFDTEPFVFAGFPPRKGKQRAAWIERLSDWPATTVVFESPRRVSALLAELTEAGLGSTPACVCRELTKMHEEVRRGTVSALADYYADGQVRGEVTLVLAAVVAPEPAVADAAADGRRLAAELAADGSTTREIVERLKRELGLPRNAAYELAIGAERERDAEEGEAT